MEQKELVCSQEYSEGPQKDALVIGKKLSGI